MLLPLDSNETYFLQTQKEPLDPLTFFLPSGLLVDELYEFGNGCICCSLKSEFLQTLHRLVHVERATFDLLLIELTGMADPGPVARIFGDPEISSHFLLKGIVTVVDAKHIQSHLEKGFYKAGTLSICFPFSHQFSTSNWRECQKRSRGPDCGSRFDSAQQN